jgi:glycosyltransferase involved in cell wall biosynthesis
MWQSVVEAMRAKGHEVWVLASDHGAEGEPGEEDPQIRRELRWYWRDHGFPALSLRERWGIERGNLRALDRHLREIGPDLVSFWAMGGMSMSLVEKVRRLGLPAIANVHEDWLLYGPRADSWQRAFGRRGLATAAELVSGIPSRLRFEDAALWLFNSEATRAAALERWPLRRTEVITPGVDLDLFTEAPEPQWSGRLLCIGRIDPRKGIATAIAALAQLPECTLTIVGPGDEAHAEELRRQATSLGVEPRVTFERVPREELPAVLAGADALLFPVLWEEPWGLVPLEAMATGTPVIASGRGGSAEFLRDGQNSLIVAEAESGSAFASAVTTLRDDPGLRARLRLGGLETAAAHSLAAFDERVVSAHEREAG